MSKRKRSEETNSELEAAREMYHAAEEAYNKKDRKDQICVLCGRGMPFSVMLQHIVGCSKKLKQAFEDIINNQPENDDEESNDEESDDSQELENYASYQRLVDMMATPESIPDNTVVYQAIADRFNDATDSPIEDVIETSAENASNHQEIISVINVVEPKEYETSTDKPLVMIDDIEPKESDNTTITLCSDITNK